MSRSKVSNRLIRHSRLRPRVQGLESRLLLTGGTLDSTFGGGTGYYLGNVVSSDQAALREISTVQVESDNSILALGTNGQPGLPESSTVVDLVHINSNGTLDTSFGTNGEATLPLPTSLPAGTTVVADQLLIQPDGAIVVVASATSPTATYELIAEFDAHGQIVPNFDIPSPSYQNSNGVGVVNLTAYGLDQANLPFAAFQGGSLLLVGTSLNSETQKSEITAIQLSLDVPFGTDGTVMISDLTPSEVGANGNESFDGVVIQPNGQIVILANITYGPTTIIYGSTVPTDTQTSIPELIRLNPNGSRDTTISQAGLTSANLLVPEQIIVQPNGQLLVLGKTALSSIGLGSSGTLVVARLNADGTLASTATLPASATTTVEGVTIPLATVYKMALQPNGDLDLIGTGFLPPRTAVNYTQVIRLTPDLTPDLSFGTDGVSNVAIDPPGQGVINPVNLAIGPNNQVVLVGSGAANPSSGGESAITDVVVGRLTATGPAIPGDFTGDGIADLAVYLPASGSFAIRPSSGGADEIIPFGLPGSGQTIPAPGDYTGSGKTEIGAYLPSQGVYAYRPADGGPDVLQSFGIPGPGQSIPAPGDYFGTGQDDVAVYMPSIGSFGIRNPKGGPDEIIPFGTAGLGQSIPAPGDYFGFGETDLAVYLTSIGAFAIRNPNGGPDEIIPFGIPGAGNSIPIPGDYDGSGKTELAVYFPKLGEFAYRPANGGPDVIVKFGAANDGSLPVPGDYDGSGKTEIAVYDPKYASFAYRPAGGGPDVIESFGTAGVGASIPTATPAGALPQFSGVVKKSSVVSTLSLAVPSGPSTALKKINRLVVNQARLDPADRLL